MRVRARRQPLRGRRARVPLAPRELSRPRLEKLADYMVNRVVVHGERRAREMEEVSETLRSIGVEPIMAEAAARRQD